MNEATESTTSHASGFDPAPYAIPILRNGGTELGTGTGFLGRRNGVVSLYTAAHVVYGLHPVATPQWHGWPLEVGVFVDFDRAPTPLRVFTVTKPTAASPYLIAATLPNFSWAPELGSPYMRDAIKFNRDGMLPLLAKCEDRFSVVELDTAAHALTTNDHLTCVGFPLPPGFWAPGGRWPYFPPTPTDGNFVRIKDGHIQADFPMEHGHSGGPVFTDDGHFAGMAVGTNPEPGSPHEIARMITAKNISDL